MNFERNIDPKSSLGIGKSQKRVFKDVEEVAQWALYFPKEYSDGEIDNWFAKDQKGNYYFNFSKGEFSRSLTFTNPGATERQSSLLYFVKWLKKNVHFDPWPQEIIGLKECKQIVDRLQELIMEAYNEEFLVIREKTLERLKKKYATH